MRKRFASLLGSGSLKHQLVRGSLAGIAVRVMSVLAAIVSSVVLARALGPDQFGLYSYVIALVLLLAIPVQMGLPYLIVRETASAEATRNWPRLSGIWTWASGLIAVGSIAVVGLALLWLLLFGDHMEATRRQAFMWALPLIPLLAFGQARAAALRGLRRVFMGQFPDEVLRPALLAVLIGAAAFSAQVTAKFALMLHVAVALLVFLIGAFLLLRARPKELIENRTMQVEHGRWLRAIIPLSLLAGLEIISQNTSIIMLGFFWTDADVGIYKIAVSGASFVVFGLTAISMVVQPHIARLHTQGDTTRLQELASVGALISFAITIPVVLLFVMAGPSILSLLYGSDYVSAYRALVILSIAQGVNSFFGLVGSFLLMSGNEWETAKGLTSSTVASVALNGALIPPFGTEGAAIATALSIVLWNVLFWRSTRRLLHIDSTPIPLLRGRRVR